jgi:hypothetical protein
MSFGDCATSVTGIPADTASAINLLFIFIVGLQIHNHVFGFIGPVARLSHRSDRIPLGLLLLE